ncbi:MAG: TRAP transporter small permease, partial [Peptostreptococcaceae bacterium]
MKKFITWMDENFEPMMMVILFGLMSGLVCLQVILRFCFKTGISWAEECSRFLFVWLMYFSIAEATKKNRNIKISYFVSKLNEKSQKFMYIFSDLLIFVFSAMCLYAAYNVCATTARFNDRAVTMDLSLNFVYGAGLVGFVL